MLCMRFTVHKHIICIYLMHAIYYVQTYNVHIYLMHAIYYVQIYLMHAIYYAQKHICIYILWMRFTM